MRHLCPALAACAVFASAGGATPAPASKPNVVFILADDLGYGDLGCYGQTRIPTPQIDRLAREGVRFTQFYAGATVCAPSRNVLLTGQHGGHIQVRGNAKIGLRSEDTTVATVFRQAGYATGIIGKWGLGSEGTDAVPTRKGFDYFFGYVDQTHAHNYYPTFLVRNETRVPLPNVVPDEGRYGQGVATKKAVYSDDLLIQEALQFIERHKAGPFFLYLPFTLPHANDEARANGMEIPDYGPFARESWPDPEKGFAAMVARLDQDVGRILAKLDELGLAGNTLVIFTSDNGPHQEGGHHGDFFHSRGPLRGFKRDLTEGGIREPMIARWPGRITPGSTTDHVGYFGDFFATAAALTGQPVPPGRDSLSFLPALEGRPEQQPKHGYLYWEFYEGRSAQAVRFGDWKAIRSPMLTGPVELYDLATDLAEVHDLAPNHPELVARAKALMDEAHVPNPLWIVNP